MADKNELKDAKKPKKDGVQKRRFRRTRETWSELKKVTWPTPTTVIKNTGLVFLVVGIFLVLLLIFDVLLMVFVFNPLTRGTLGNPIEADIIRAIKPLFNIISGRLL